MYLIYRNHTDPTCILLPPHTTDPLPSATINRIAAALATKYNVSKSIARKYVPPTIDQYGKVRRVDSDAGDTMQASQIGKKNMDYCDATFI